MSTDIFHCSALFMCVPLSNNSVSGEICVYLMNVQHIFWPNADAAAHE